MSKRKRNYMIIEKNSGFVPFGYWSTSKGMVIHVDMTAPFNNPFDAYFWLIENVKGEIV